MLNIEKFRLIVSAYDRSHKFVVRGAGYVRNRCRNSAEACGYKVVVVGYDVCEGIRHEYVLNPKPTLRLISRDQRGVEFLDKSRVLYQRIRRNYRELTRFVSYGFTRLRSYSLRVVNKKLHVYVIV